VTANISKRQLMLAGAGLMTSQLADAFPVCTQAKNQICNVTKLYSVTASDIVVAKDVGDIRRILKSDTKQISIGGGRYSMGGQTAISQGVQIDMRSFKQLVWIKPMERIVRVQAGMRWRDLQTILDPLDLSVQTMQSYANFTVGGAISVNCHGRYVGHGSIVYSVRSLQLVLPSGQALEVNRQNNAELFYAAVGGYGAVGIVTEVELDLDTNFKIERSTARVPLMDYPEWFGSQIQANKDVLLHNADLTPPAFDAPFCVTWSKSDKPVTTVQRLTPEGQAYKKEQLAIWAMTELPKGEKLRAAIQKTHQKNEVVWRNHEASLDVAELEPASREVATYVLQEYFVPVSQFKAYVQDLTKLMRSMATQTVNISIRHSKVDSQTLMSWAKEDVFCFVVFYKQRMQVHTEVDVGRWTRAMIDLALKHKGRYYLPYQPHATQTQFEQAYPEAKGLRRLRKELGATRLSNMMWDRYKV
jgi:FAD/FMN-containing dehydrogenase